MLNRVLITLDDIKGLRPTADLDGVRLEPFIQEAQDMDLSPVLGDVLFNDFITKFWDTGDAMYANYQTLLNGVSWTYNGDVIQFKGVKHFMVYKTLARFVQDQPLNITRFGVVTKIVNGSQPVDPQLIRQFVNTMNSNAQTIQNQICLYLNSNTTTYTKFKGEQTNLRTGFRILNGSYNKSFY